MKYLFLDTNLFLHYKGYEDIPWKTLLNTKDEISIVIASIILREINGHKDSSKGRVKNKARKISEKLNSILLKGQQSRVPLIYCRETPIKDDEKNVFDLTVNDDRFLINVLHSSFPKEDVFVVSNDTDLLLKAKESGLNILPMDETYRSSEEPTEEEKELKKVKEELERWTNRRSSPKVMFADTDENCITFECIHYKPLEELVEESVSKEASRYPEERVEVINYDNYFANYHTQLEMLARQISMRDPAQKAVFNQMRKEYIEAFRKKETLVIQRKMRDYAFKKLKLRVYNGGTAQTGDLHIVLRFSENAKLYSKNVSMETYEYEPPVTPQYDRALASLQNMTSLTAYGYRPDNTVRMWNPEKPIDDFEFTTELSRLTHGLEVEIDKDIYINTEELQEFEIEWFIADSSLVDHCYGKLKVVVADKDCDSGDE